MSSRKEILELIKKHSTSRRPIMPEFEFVADLGIDGDDADEFFEELQERFPKRLSNIDWALYFHSEGELLSYLYLPRLVGYKLGLLKSPPLRKLESFTVGKLLEIWGV